MAFTLKDLDTIDAAICSGELTIRAADGRLVTMRDISELMQARAIVISGIAALTGAVQRRYPRYQLSDFSD